ncbi:protein ROLLING AND ERECT LEAF 2-like [Phragmites australis]|uniref:protein ROLLING AND ERECT LEAF 2-like n=1 Tax=Phragmites australis TaxID=29695 RepID=UPI002D771D54|nr:protein ROLLING AND ERECT LEAF 2-like [Phragmites australis]XP_062211077.1 protein ROLLING AND ERECT LEAF 2-like [Phragmites australis]XP_062211078.1 protein ROLLING AND ERECT LEAF 2-like [Phragmites australis]
MGSRSKNEDDTALVLCQERKRFVREALDGRCAFAAAHFAYIQSLRHTGFALRKFVEPEVPTDSSLYTSTSATPEPPIIRQKSMNLSPSLSHHASDSFSPVPSPLSSGRFHVNHMKARGNSVTTVEEKVPVPVTATLQTSSPVRRQSVHDLDDSFTFEAPPGTPPWDYFGLFRPVENQISFHDEKELGHDFEDADDIRRLREKEGIPELEEEVEKSPDNIKHLGEEKAPDFKDVEKSAMNGVEDDLALSEDDFDNPTSESLVRVFKNRNDMPVANTATSQSPAHLASEKAASETSEQAASETIDSQTQRPRNDTRVLDISMYETDETPVTSPVKEVASSVAVLSMNGKLKEPFRDERNVVRDLNSCMKEVEILFMKAFDSGKEVPKMLEADKVHFRPLLPEEKAPGLTASGFFATFFACCRGEEVPIPQPPPQAEVKYLTWHRSMSSLSSSSRNPLGTTSKDDTDGLTGNIFSGVYMNAGSHASTLDRLYAWERKLYDEVKASSAICRKYDEKCNQLRHQESRGESQMSIDKTRAVVKDLHSRILVAIQRIDMISKKIEDLRDKELQPQLEELIGSLTCMWTTMLECHRHQHEIIKLVSNSGNTKVLIRSESQFQATLLLQVELSTLCSNFQKWIASHRSYLHSLNSWLLKCVKSLRRRKKSRKKKEADIPITNYAVAPIFKTCENWIKLLDKLPNKDLEDAIRGLAANINRSMPRQEKRRGSSKLTFSLSHSGGLNGEKGGIHRNDPPMDLQSSLETFLGKLEAFSDVSLDKYIKLKKEIDDAKVDYEK